MRDFVLTLRTLTATEVQNMTTDQLMSGRAAMLDRLRNQDFVHLATRFLKEVGQRATASNIEAVMLGVRDILTEELMNRT